MRGYKYFVHPITQIPIFRYKDPMNKKYKFGFFRYRDVIDNDIVKNCFMGYSFKITNPDLHLNISKSK